MSVIFLGHSVFNIIMVARTIGTQSENVKNETRNNSTKIRYIVINGKCFIYHNIKCSIRQVIFLFKLNVIYTLYIIHST